MSGGLIKERDAKRPVRVEVWNGKDTKICSVLAPSEYFKELPLSERKVSPARIVSWMRKHRGLRALTFTAVGLGFPSVVVWLLDSILGITIPAMLTAIVCSLGAISSNLLASSVQGFLATRHPEDARLVE